jgi:hypothetical protein
VIKMKFCALLSIFFLVLPPLLDADAGPAVLVMEKSASGLTYLLNGKEIGKTEGLLLALSRCRDADTGKDPELTILASEELPFVDITQVMGIAGKARYFRFRVFVFDKHKRVMYELTYSKSVPFSTTVPGVGAR